MPTPPGPNFGPLITGLGNLTAALNKKAKKEERAGDVVARFADRLSKIPALARGAAASVGVNVPSLPGLLNKGFSGTVQGNLFDRELTLLSRELAGAFRPVIDTATKLARSLRQLLESAGPQVQNIIRGTALAGAGYGLYRGASALFRDPAAAAAAKAAAAPGGSAAATAAGAAGGAAKKGSRLAAAAKVGGILAVGGALATEAMDSDGYYEMLLRRRGVTKDKAGFGDKVLAGIGAAGGATLDVLTLGAFGRRMREKGELGGGSMAKTGVTLEGGGFEEVGSAYDRLQMSLGQVDTGGSGPGAGDDGPGWAKALSAAVADLSMAIKGGAGVARPGGP